MLNFFKISIECMRPPRGTDSPPRRTGVSWKGWSLGLGPADTFRLIIHPLRVPRQLVYGHFVYGTSSTDISSTTVLYTSVQDSYTSNFCFRKSLFSLIPTSTYTMIPFYQSHFH